MKSTIFSILLSALCLPALATEGQWEEGYGQGMTEYLISKDGYTLYISCPPSYDDDHYAGYMLTGKAGNGSANFTVTLNGKTYDGPMESDNRAGASNVRAFLRDIRLYDAVVKFRNQTIVFPKSNAAKVIPTGKKMSCHIGW